MRRTAIAAALLLMALLWRWPAGADAGVGNGIPSLTALTTAVGHAHPELVTMRARVASAIEDFNVRVRQFNTDCGSVDANNAAAVQDCSDRQAQLEAQKRTLLSEIAEYNNDVTAAVTAGCKDLDSHLSIMKTAGSRAALALDVYSLFGDNEKAQLKSSPWQAPWKAPPGYTLISNNILETRKLLPDMDSAMIKKFLAPDNSDYRAAIYRDNTKGTIFLVFRGSENNIGNWSTNVGNELGLYTNYLGKAGALAADLKKYTDKNGLQLECVGHSLGGGMCISAAVHAHIKGTVFNAETTHSSALAEGDEIETAGDLVVDYVTPREAVTTSQNALFVAAPGLQVALPDWPGGPTSPFERHSMRFVRLSIQNQIQEIQKEKADNNCGP